MEFIPHSIMMIQSSTLYNDDPVFALQFSVMENDDMYCMLLHFYWIWQRPILTRGIKLVAEPAVLSSHHKSKSELIDGNSYNMISPITLHNPSCPMQGQILGTRRWIPPTQHLSFWE